MITNTPYCKSLLYDQNYLYINNITIKSIDYNRILWKFNRHCYDIFGWTCLSRHYAEFVYTFEYNYRWLMLTDDDMNNLKTYVKEDIRPWKYNSLQLIDIEMFELNCDRLIYYLHRLLGHKIDLS